MKKKGKAARSRARSRVRRDVERRQEAVNTAVVHGVALSPTEDAVVLPPPPSMTRKTDG